MKFLVKEPPLKWDFFKVPLMTKKWLCRVLVLQVASEPSLYIKLTPGNHPYCRLKVTGREFSKHNFVNFV